MPSTITGRLAAALATTVVVGASAASASAAPTPANAGCPAAYERLSVTWFAPPYILPRLVDDDGNGWVCAYPLPAAVRDAACAKFDGGPPCQLKDLGLPMYQFKDDDNPAGLR